ncbi:MAG: nucleoside recognition protein [Prevotellaceae bacterium]|jgi:spore maturation protein SpmB|nr:nucleoside recognition protein [Prevotellaceae bacterium]
MVSSGDNTASIRVRILKSIKEAMPSALKTGRWMVKVTLIVSLAVTILQYFGIVGRMSESLTPVFRFLGLPGESALVFISGYFVNIYSAIAVIVTLEMSARSITILAVMCLCAHNMFIETAVQKKTGSSVLRMTLVRTLSAFALGFFLNRIMPEATTTVEAQEPFLAEVGFGVILKNWLISAGWLILKMMTLIISLSISQRLLAEFGAIGWLSKLLRPVMKAFGLPAKTSFLWIVANILGLAYGSAVMIEESERGAISREDVDLLNHHIGISHSNLEDVILFASVGGMVLWMLFTRWAASIVIVWLRKLELVLKKQ